MKTALIGLPMYTLSRYSGMEKSPGALRKAGIAKVFEGIDLGDVALQGVHGSRGPKNMKNLERFLQDSEMIRSRLSKVEGVGRVVSLGGECSMIVGELAGLKVAMKGSPGMVWIDSHGDFNVPGTSPSGYIGGMCLALASGRGPKLSPEVDAVMPLIEEEKLVHLGSRALDEAEIKAMTSSPMRMVSTDGMRKGGIDAESRASAKWLSDRCDWIVCHLDVDVIDPVWMPSVNYPTPNGITPGEAARLLVSFAATGKLAALDVAAYNAGLDRDGRSARLVVDLLSRAFRP